MCSWWWTAAIPLARQYVDMEAQGQIWLDEAGLIMEPEVQDMAIRFTDVPASRNYHLAVRMPDDVGLGAPAIIRPPHLFNVVLAASRDEAYTFRYHSGMSVYTD